MTFIAEFISEADKERYRLDSYMPKARGNNWVIDRERDCFLRYLDRDSSRLDVGGTENPYEHWLFYYQGAPIILDMCFNGSKEHRPCLTYQIDHIYIYISRAIQDSHFFTKSAKRN